MSSREAVCRAVSRLGELAANARANCLSSRSWDSMMPSPTTHQNAMMMMTPRLTVIASMISASLTNTEADSHRRRSLTDTASDEAVAGAAHGADERRPFRIVAELLTQAADQYVDRSVVRLPVDAAGLVHDPLAGHDAAAIPHQQRQQLELGGRQRQLLAVQSYRVRGPVHLQRADA